MGRVSRRCEMIKENRKSKKLERKSKSALELTATKFLYRNAGYEELSEGLGWTIAWAAEQQGYIVTDINELGAAFMSGFKVGDKIISMDAQELSKMDEETSIKTQSVLSKKPKVKIVYAPNLNSLRA